MTTTVYLVRHGLTESNTRNLYMGRSAEDLNETGRKQAQALSSRLTAYPVAAVYSSPMQRTISTANILSGPHRLTPVITPDLREMELGEWEGHLESVIKATWPELFKKWTTDPSDLTMPGGESLDDVGVRSVRALRQIMEANPDKTVLAVAHDVNIRLIVMHVLGCSNHIYRRLRVDNASLTVINAKRLQFRVLSLNDTGHLENISL